MPLAKSLPLAAVLLMLSGCAAQHPPLPTVEYVDLDRYLGTWYEIARYPAPFQEGCVATSATYTPHEDGGWSLVGEPSREYLWILSRSRHLNPDVFNDIVARLPALGYDPDQLIITPQPDTDSP